MRSVLFVIVLLMLLAVPVVPVAAAEPGLTVTSPTDGAVLETTSVTVRFELTNFTLMPSEIPFAEAGQRPDVNQPNQGHLHLRLDLGPVVVLDRSESYTFTDVPPGEHQLTVDLSNNDHSALSPPVVRQVRFRTAAPTPAMMPDTGQDSWLQHAGGPGLLVCIALVLIAAGWSLQRRYAVDLLPQAVRIRRVRRGVPDQRRSNKLR